MLTLERWRRRSIYSLGGRRGTRASALYCAQTDGAGCPGLQEWPDVRARGPDVRARGENSCGLWIDEAGFPDRGPDFGASREAGCPGSWSDVWGLEGELARFRWFSSSVNLAACPSSRASSGGSS